MNGDNCLASHTSCFCLEEQSLVSTALVFWWSSEEVCMLWHEVCGDSNHSHPAHRLFSTFTELSWCWFRL